MKLPLRHLALRTIASTRLGAPLVGLICLLFALGSYVYLRFPELYRFRLYNDWSAPRWHSVAVAILLVLHGLLVVHLIARVARFERARRRTLGFVLTVTQLALTVVSAVFVAWIVRPLPEEYVVGETPTEIHGESYRVLRIEPGDREATPPKRTQIWLERKANGKTSQVKVGRRRYWASECAPYDLSIARAELTSKGVIVRRGTERIVLEADRPHRERDRTLRWRGTGPNGSRSSGRIPTAELEIGGTETTLPFDPEWAGQHTVLGHDETPVCVMRVHRNLTLPFAFGAALHLLLLGAVWFAERRGRGGVS